MRTAKGKELAVGLVALSLLSFALFAAQARKPQLAGMEISADFPAVGGVEVGSKVQLGGVEIGEVTDISLSDTLRPEMRMVVSVSFPEDSSASVQSAGLFGDKVVVIEPGGSLDYIRDGSRLILTEGSLLLDDLLAMVIRSAEEKRGGGK